MDRDAGMAALACRFCGQMYTTRAGMLTEPIDVCHDWIIDACEDAVVPEDRVRVRWDRHAFVLWGSMSLVRAACRWCVHAQSKLACIQACF
jgi:Transcription elongation factor Elf1 like